MTPASTKTDAMKRYSQATGGDMEEYELGEWVRHEEAFAAAPGYAKLAENYRKAWHALNALKCDGSGYAARIVNELPDPRGMQMPPASHNDETQRPPVEKLSNPRAASPGGSLE